jgi:hypothetical protein
MASSRIPGPMGLDGPFHGIYPAETPGPLGLNDQADPNVFSFLGDTPGPLGINDYADPDLRGAIRSPIGVRSRLILNSSSGCTRCHYEVYQEHLRSISWRIIWLFERGGKYRELYNQEASQLSKLEGRLPKAKLEELRGQLKSKYQEITPPEIEAGLKAILGEKKYAMRKATGNFNPGKTNEAVNTIFKGMKWAGRIVLVVSLYGEYQAISQADDWSRQLGSSSSGILGSIGGGALGAAATRMLLAVPQVGNAVPHPWVRFAIVTAGSIVAAYAGYEYSSGIFESLYDIYVCELETNERER